MERATDAGAEFAEFVGARQHALLRTAYLLTGDTATAEDVVQNALAKLYLAWDKVRDKGAVEAYARRTVVNEVNSLWRRAWKRHEVSVDAVPETAAPESDSETAAQVWQWVRSLPPRQRAVVVLRYYEQLSESEIADVLGVSPGTVKSQASRALDALRSRVPESLLPEGDER
jgi:RNA polymerase sigma-70 factor (sigma-E family)